MTTLPAAIARPRDVPHGTAAIRLMRKAVVAPSGCWIWQGSCTPNGYGSVGIGSTLDGSRRLSPAHRVSYEVFCGPIPAGYFLDHLCRTPKCINPNHLQPVTPAENTRRGDGGKFWAAKTECPRGHPYDEANTYVNRGRRFCRECSREWNRAAYWRAKA